MSIDLIARLKLVDNMTKPLRSATASLAGFGVKMASVGVAVAAVGAATIAFKSLNKAMDFESGMSSIKALTGLGTVEMAKMSALALKMGADTKYNALEASQGIEELLRAGLTPATVQAGGLEAALNLATAGGLDLASAAEIMSTALNAFKKDGISAAQAADILAGTANASATGVEELRYSLAAVSAVAAGAGLSFKDTNLALGVFANNGLKGSDAGTSLKTMLLTLQPITKTQRKLFDGLGFTSNGMSNAFYDANGNLKSMADISGVLKSKLGKLNNANRQMAMKMMFGTDAIRAANILYEEGAEGIAKFEKEMSNVTAFAVAKEKMNNASGAVEQFSGAIETLQIAAMLPILPYIKKIALGAADLVERYTPRITAAIERMTKTAAGYLNTHFLKNPSFTKLPDLQSKIKFVFDDIKATIDAWWAGGGAVAFENLTAKIIGVLVNGLEKSIPLVTPVAAKIGAAIGNGVVAGIRDNLDILDVISPTRKAYKDYNDKWDGAVSLVDRAKKNSIENPGKPLFTGGEMKATEEKPWYKKVTGALGIGKSGGIDNVPYNNYEARLHAGEAVLTREENKSYREGNGGKSAPSIVIQNVSIHNEMDYQTFVGRLARDLAM